LEVISALSGNSDLIAHDLSRNFQLGITDERRDLLCHRSFDSLLDYNNLARVAERRNIRILSFDVF
jgi:hypothetical protein